MKSLSAGHALSRARLPTARRCLATTQGKDEEGSPTIELRYTQSSAALAGSPMAVSHRSKHYGECRDVNDGYIRYRSVPRHELRFPKARSASIGEVWPWR